MTYNTVCSQARTDTECVLVARALNGSVALYHLCAHENSRSSSQPGHPLAGLFHISSLPVYHSTQEEPLLKTSANAIRSATLKNHSYTQTMRVPRSCAQTLPQQQHVLRTELENKTNVADLGCLQSSCLKGGLCYFEHVTAKQAKSEGHRSRALVKRDNLEERHIARKTGESPSGKEDRSLCFNYIRGNCSHDRV